MSSISWENILPRDFQTNKASAEGRIIIGPFLCRYLRCPSHPTCVPLTSFVRTYAREREKGKERARVDERGCLLLNWFSSAFYWDQSKQRLLPPAELQLIFFILPTPCPPLLESALLETKLWQPMASVKGSASNIKVTMIGYFMLHPFTVADSANHSLLCWAFTCRLWFT